ncbi:class II SORL domain-containing protein [Desulfohalovibrio reitneri]|uniref:class II SORL domain-containing protein n=1 Tax=Desulfohalovibrio reitneri TaxID=1307759 RepID=UPI0004A6C8B9|nr:class II SORL domain-containing protein [Desulfohalovibrio reitneri]
MKIGELYKTADWKSEKHVPVIECPDSVARDDFFQITVSLGKEVAHPNTTEHHISWIEVYFMPEGEKFVQQVARFEFSAHGQSVEGPNEGTVYTHHTGTCSMKTGKPGTILATAYCNIHGLWENSRKIGIS